MAIIEIMKINKIMASMAFITTSFPPHNMEITSVFPSMLPAIERVNRSGLSN